MNNPDLTIQGQGLDEQWLRYMRDLVFGIPSTGNNWAACRDRWAQPEEVAWLIAKTNWPMEPPVQNSNPQA